MGTYSVYGGFCHFTEDISPLIPFQHPPKKLFPNILNPHFFLFPNIVLTPQHFFVPNIFEQYKSIFWGGSHPIFVVVIFIFLGKYKFGCKHSEPLVKSFWEKSTHIEERRERNNSVNIGHCVRCRTAHALCSDKGT